MELWFQIVLGLLLTVGVLGCFIPVIPGPLISYASLFLLFLVDSPIEHLGWFLAVAGAFCVVVMCADTFLPPIIVRKFGGGKSGSWGSLVGAIVGLFFFPWGLILGAFLGAFLFEMIFAHQHWTLALRSGCGAFLGFLLGTALKLAYCVACFGVLFA